MRSGMDRFGKHSLFIELMNQAGYFSNPQGICFGLTLMAVQGAVLGEAEFNRFQDRLALIYLLSKSLEEFRINQLNQTGVNFLMFFIGKDSSIEKPYIDVLERKIDQTRKTNAEFNKKVEDYMTKYISQQSGLTANQTRFLATSKPLAIDIAAFFEGVEIYFQPFRYPQLFSNDVTINFYQDANISAPLVEPLGFKTLGIGLKQANIGYALYAYRSRDDLVAFFEKLNHLVKKILPAAFVFSSGTHVITITFQCGQWYLIDANQGIIQCENAIVLAEKVCLAFNTSLDQLGKEECAAVFSITTYSSNQSNVRDEEMNVLNQDNINADNVNCKDALGNNMLFMALSGNQHRKLFRKFLECGINLNARLNADSTLLHMVVMRREVDFVQCLLENHAEINLQTVNGDTPLHLAVRNRYTDVVRLLLDYHAIKNIKNQLGETPLHVAVQEGQIEIANALIQADNIDLQNAVGDTPLHIAVSRNNIEMVRELLQHGANVNAINHSGDTPLHMAVHLKHQEIVRMLLEHACIDLTLKNNLNETPFEMAKNLNHHEISDAILQSTQTWGQVAAYRTKSSH